VLAGDYNVVPTDHDIYAVRSYADDALLQPEPRAQFQKLLRQGWRDALRALHPDAALYTYWSYLRNRWPRDAGLRIDHLPLSALAAKRLAAAGVDREVRGEAGASGMQSRGAFSANGANGKPSAGTASIRSRGDRASSRTSRRSPTKPRASTPHCGSASTAATATASSST